MDINAKIKDARQQAGFTQEEVADALGVSRQTISNWETEKTYPDIISVVKMSDLYNISLDQLLKGESSTNNYLNYLEENTNIVKSHSRLAKIILIAVYLGVWAISVSFYWLFTGPTDVMAYSLIFMYFLLPVTTFVLSVIIGANNYWKNLKWITAIIFGIFYFLADFTTSSVCFINANQQWLLPNYMLIARGFLISLIGLAIGSILHAVKNKRSS